MKRVIRVRRHLRKGRPVRMHLKDWTKLSPGIKLGPCDFCGSPAKYDAKTNMGPWANMCAECYSAHGVGLGLGKWQRLEE